MKISALHFLWRPRPTRRPLLWVCLCLILGIVAHAHVKVLWPVFAAFCVLSALWWIVLRRSRADSWIILFTVIGLGAFHAINFQTFAERDAGRIPYWERANIESVEGTVISDPECRSFFRGKKTVFALKLDRIKTEGRWKDKTGKILVQVFREEKFFYGDYLSLSGKLHRPVHFTEGSTFSYRDYLSRKGIVYILSVKKNGRARALKHGQGSSMVEALFCAKHRLAEILMRYLQEEDAGIMRAFLLGDRYGIPSSVYDLFKVSGVAHIIAISGFNIGITACGLLFLLKMLFVPRWGQYVITMAALAGYAILTGGQPSVIRAVIMAAAFLTAFLIEREQDSLTALALSAIIILGINPLSLFDVGFQLSFISVMAMAWLYPVIYEKFAIWAGLTRNESLSEDVILIEKARGWGGVKERGLQYILQSISLSIAVYLAVGPLIAYYFHLVTPVVIAANLVIVPLASLLIFLGMGLLLTGILAPFLAFAFANCVTVALNLMAAGVIFFARLPWAYVPLTKFDLWQVLVYYALLFAGILFFQVWERKNTFIRDFSIER